MKHRTGFRANNGKNEHGVKAAHVKSPLKGEVIKPEEVQDKAFSSGALGKGLPSFHQKASCLHQYQES
ncbi:hypothetical protein ACEQPO_01010 [Bacillus sp. SL00103]